MPRKEHHVVPSDEVWNVKKGGGEKAIKHLTASRMQWITLDK